MNLLSEPVKRELEAASREIPGASGDAFGLASTIFGCAVALCTALAEIANAANPVGRR